MKSEKVQTYEKVSIIIPLHLKSHLKRVIRYKLMRECLQVDELDYKNTTPLKLAIRSDIYLKLNFE